MSILRPPLQDHYKDICFQIIDWSVTDILVEEEEEESPSKKVFVIRGYGVTEEGHSICIHLNGFRPYFYFRIPQEWTESTFKKFKLDIQKCVYLKGIMSGSIVHKKEFYGFTNNEFFKYGMFSFDNQSSYYNCLYLFKEMMNKRLGIKNPDAKENKRLPWIMSKYPFDFKLYETKVTSLLRFFHEKNLDPSGWFKIEKGKYDREKRMTRVQIEIEASYHSIQKVEKNDIARLLVASFDIECCSQDGSFPK